MGILCGDVPVDFPLWQHAVTHNLERLESKCAGLIKNRPAEYVSSMTPIIDTVSEEILQKIWPCLCKHAKIDATDMPSVPALRSFWPFISKAVRFGAAIDNAPDWYLFCSTRGSHCGSRFREFKQTYLQ